MVSAEFSLFQIQLSVSILNNYEEVSELVQFYAAGVGRNGFGYTRSILKIQMVLGISARVKILGKA